MLPIGSMHVGWEWELVKWLALLTAATALLFAFASRPALGATPEGAEPAVLPEDMDRVAKPMGEAAAGTRETPVESAAMDPAAALWKVLERHRLGDHEEAAAGWKALDLPAEMRAWRWIGWGTALMEMGRLEAGAELYNRAWDLDDENAALHYFAGMLFLEEAHRALEWNDAMGPEHVHFAAVDLPKIVPNSRSMFTMAAAMEMEKAIDLAGRVPFDAALLPESMNTRMAVMPTVGDLLMALGANDFPAKASQALGAIHLGAGRLDEAERRMDEAARGGLPMLDAYRRLADRYEELGRLDDAARARQKDAHYNPAPEYPRSRPESGHGTRAELL